MTNVAQGGLNAGRGAVDAVRGFSGGGAGDGAGQKMLSNPNNTSLAYGVGNLGVRGAMAAGRAMKRVAGSAGAAASSAFGDGNSASGSGGNTVRPSSGRFDSNK